MSKASNAPDAHAVDPHSDPEILRGMRYAQAIAVALANVSALPGWLTIPALGRDMRPLGDVAAQRVMDVADAEIARAKAEALREAAEAYGPAQISGLFTSPTRYMQAWLIHRADEIEAGR